MYTETTINSKQTANDIFDQLRLDYRYVKPKNLTLNEAINDLAKRLAKLKQHEIICWSQALSNLMQVTTGHPPTSQEIIKEMKKVAYRVIEEASYVTSHQQQEAPQLDYAKLWHNATVKERFRFFIDHRFCDVPSFVRLAFHQYNQESRGWTRQESTKMMHFWRVPFPNAQQGAMINNQREIIDYFTKRKA